MSTIYLRRMQHGFIPDTESDWEAAKRFKLGQVVRSEITIARNVRFFRKWWALIEVAFGMWEETGVKGEYKGEEIRPNIERFRKDVTILAGHHHAVVNLRGEVRLEADSISFGNMQEETFEKLYNSTLTVIVHKVMRGRVSEQRLREMAQAVEEFS